MLTTMIIGNRIAEARKKTNISQAQLAQRLFISPQAVGKWERGESMPDIITFNRLAEILGVDLNYFSESLQSAPPDMGAFKPLDTQSDELTSPMASRPASGEQKQKPNWNMSRGNWVDADFSGLKNLHEKFSSSNMQRCKFISSDLTGLLLKGNNVDNCDFSNSDISRSIIQSSTLANDLFKDCSLKETEFSYSNIGGCDFSGADFTGAKLKYGSFRKNTMENAMLNRTSFSGMEITDIFFEGTVEDCSFENCAFTRVTFRKATLINTFFKNKSLKRLRFIDCQADRMTYEFLKNGKADLTGLKMLTPIG